MSTLVRVTTAFIFAAALASPVHAQTAGAIAGVSSPDGIAAQALSGITIPNAADVRGHVTLPTTLPEHGGAEVSWTSSHPDIVSDEVVDWIAAGVVVRPPVGAAVASVTLTACTTVDGDEGCRDFELSVRPQVELAEFTRYGMFNFARSNNHPGQQIYMASSIGNDATRWEAVNDGEIVLESTEGMHAVRDPSIVRSPEGDRFFLVATDLNVNGDAYGWQGWEWAQSGASRYIEVWESNDMRTWSPQRHVLVAPEEAGMTFAPEAIWDDEIQAYVVYWTSSMYPAGTHFTPDQTDPNGRFPLTRNQTLYTTTRDFVTFTPWEIMSNRPGHGTLDAVIIEDDEGYYHRLVTDRTSTGVGTTKYVRSCPSEDIYQERAASILAPENEWELTASCITHDAMATRYAEAPLIVKANPGDERGDGPDAVRDDRDRQLDQVVRAHCGSGLPAHSAQSHRIARLPGGNHDRIRGGCGTSRPGAVDDPDRPVRLGLGDDRRSILLWPGERDRLVDAGSIVTEGGQEQLEFARTVGNQAPGGRTRPMAAGIGDQIALISQGVDQGVEP